MSVGMLDEPVRIQIRRGTAAEWRAANPILAEGEPGMELETGRWKLGDSVTPWNDLAFAYGAKGEQGERGPAGTSVVIKGVVDTASNLDPDDPQYEAGMGYITEDTGHLHVFDPGPPPRFVDVGSVRGPEGPRGLQGERGLAGPQGAPGPPGSELPAGVIAMTVAATAPSGWVLCQGQAISRFLNANLFDVIGTTYGAGDGATTFNVPDLRGRALIGAGAGPGLTNRVLAATGGAETVALTEAQLASHSHAGGSHSHSVPALTIGAHTHSVPGLSFSGTTGGFNVRHSHGVQAYVVGGAWSGTVGSGVQSGTFAMNPYTWNGRTDDQLADHSHSFSGTTSTGTSGSASGSTGTGTTGAASAGTGAAGSGSAHPNMPPFMAINYLIKL